VTVGFSRWTLLHGVRQLMQF